MQTAQALTRPSGFGQSDHLGIIMVKRDLAGEWLRANAPKKMKRNRVKVVYGPAQVDDVENEAAFYRSGDVPHKKFWAQPTVPASTGEPHCQVAVWLSDNRDVVQDHCLFAPQANAGFPKSVRFNFRQMLAARAMCILAHGLPDGDGMMAIHSCGNGHLSCVNPGHLRWGGGKDNANDARLHTSKSGAVTEGAVKALHIHPLPKVAAVLSGETAESIRAARKVIMRPPKIGNALAKHQQEAASPKGHGG